METGFTPSSFTPGTASALTERTVFLKMSPTVHEKMQQHAYFYYWNDLKEEVRLVFSFDNTVEEIDEFVSLLKEYAAQ